MNRKFYRAIKIICFFSGLIMLLSCSKSSSGSGGSISTDTIPTILDTIPANIIDIRSSSSTTGLTLIPYPGIPSIPNLISALGLGYYYIYLGSSDTVTFTLTADSSGGGNAGLSGQTSDSGPNYFTSGDSLQFLVTAVQYTGPFGGTGTAYYTNDFMSGYSLSATDTLNFSNAYTGASVYSSSLVSNNTYNLFNREAYIAFRLTNNLGYRYGWMLLSSDPSSGNLLSVYEIAYNTNYDVPIAMGKYK